MEQGHNEPIRLQGLHLFPRQVQSSGHRNRNFYHPMGQLLSGRHNLIPLVCQSPVSLSGHFSHHSEEPVSSRGQYYKAQLEQCRENTLLWIPSFPAVQMMSLINSSRQQHSASTVLASHFQECKLQQDCL